LVRKAHWQGVAKEKIRYRSNDDYQEHFLNLFRQSVIRRTGKGAPILAELSGGMDSSSIVCISDQMRREQGAGPSELLDTVSYYDESDPDWNEAPYFTCVELERQKPGMHLPLPLLSDDLLPAPAPDLLPGAELAAWENERRFQQKTQSDGFRVILSGIGGDELLGGVPTALPELADHFAQGHFRCFARQAVSWCLHLRRPLLQISIATIQFLLDQYSKPSIPRKALPPWATDNMRRLIQKSVDRSINGYQSLGPAPSAICNGRTWWATIETLPLSIP
jgi:asparagine synthase (glutamine-hydrolysing)